MYCWRACSHATVQFSTRNHASFRPPSLATRRLEEGQIVGIYWQKALQNEVCGMTSVISLPLGDEVKVTQKGDDDGHSSAIINSALYSAHGARNQLCAIMSKIAVKLAI